MWIIIICMCCRGVGCFQMIWSLAVLHFLPFPALDLTQILWRSVKGSWVKLTRILSDPLQRKGSASFLVTPGALPLDLPRERGREGGAAAARLVSQLKLKSHISTIPPLQ